MPLPVGAVTRGQFQAIELMRIDAALSQPPEVEVSQENSIRQQVTKSPQTATLALHEPNVIWTEQMINDDLETTSGARVSLIINPRQYNMTDYDGNGTLLADQTIHHGIQGAGNPAAVSGRVRGHGHLTEVDGTELIGAVLEAD